MGLKGKALPFMVCRTGIIPLSDPSRDTHTPTQVSKMMTSDCQRTEVVNICEVSYRRQKRKLLRLRDNKMRAIRGSR